MFLFSEMPNSVDRATVGLNVTSGTHAPIVAVPV